MSETTETIFRQISTGDKMFVGARNFVAAESSVHFNVGRGNGRKIAVEYVPADDLYTVTAHKFNRNYTEHEVVETFAGVYAEALSAVVVLAYEALVS